MTQKKKSITAPNAKEHGSKADKEVREILERIKVSPTPTTTEKKRGRGRPRGSKKAKKPAYSKKNYSQHPMAQAINIALSKIANKSVLSEATDKMTPQELEVGEAGIYLFEYYATTLFIHPIMILISAFLGMGMLTIQKLGTIPKKTKEEQKRIETGEKT